MEAHGLSDLTNLDNIWQIIDHLKKILFYKARPHAWKNNNKKNVLEVELGCNLDFISV